MQLWNIFVAFARANLLGYGGGQAIIPLVKAEVVDTFHWMTSDEFVDAMAISNTLPGPMATKMSAYIGYKVGGFGGALVGLAGAALPTAVLMVALAAVLIRFKDSPVLKGAIKAIKPVIFVLFVMLALEFLPTARPDKAGWFPALIAVASFVILYFFKSVPQWQVILGALVLGGTFLR